MRAILDDLNDIIDRELLDWQWTKAADQGRATRGAAMALKARLLLFEASKLVNPRTTPRNGRLRPMRPKP